MTDSNLYDLWAKLINEANEDHYAVDRIIYKPFAECKFGYVYIGIDSLLSKYLIIELDSRVANDFKEPNIKGLQFKIETINVLNPNKKYLKISIGKDVDIEEAFEAFCVSLVNNIKNCDNSYQTIENLNEVLKKFKNFFGECKQNKLSRIEEQGLFGELTFLKEVISSKGENYIKYWTGTSKNKHDFIFENNNGVEIKTILSQTQSNITISNENQLNYEERNNLFLRTYVLEKTPNGLSIIDLSRDIYEQIKNYENKILFRNKLLEAGVLLDKTIASLNFDVVRCMDFKIDKDFPRITKNEINSRIFNIAYKVNIDGLPMHQGGLLDEI